MGFQWTQMGWEQDLPPWAGEGDSLARGVGRFSTQHPTSNIQHPALPHCLSPLPAATGPTSPAMTPSNAKTLLPSGEEPAKESQVRHRLELLKYSEEPQPQ